jgi:putative ABC transport system ATP-binding protein
LSVLLDAKGLSKHYGEGEARVDALKHVDLEIKHGEFVAIMGPSGSGKSTLLSILGAMNPPSGGSLIVDEIDVYELSQEKQADFRREYLGFIFQQLQLIPYLTALENVMLPLVITDLKNHEELAVKVLKKVGLGKKLDKLPSELSGGEQGRIAIARAVVNEPPVLLADEPTGSLDSKTGEEIMFLFHELHGDGQTIIMVTHNEENAAHADRIISIKDGEVVSDNDYSQEKLKESRENVLSKNELIDKIKKG